MKVLINVQPLSSGHAIRGVGMYTRFLSEALEKQPGIELYRSSLVQRPKKIDIVHYPFFDLFFPTLPLAKFSKTIVTIHDVIPLLFPKEYPVGKRGWLAFAHQKLALKTVAKVITDSQASQQDIATHLGVPLGKIAVVPLAANPFLQPLPASKLKTAKRKLKLPEKYILYAPVLLSAQAIFMIPSEATVTVGFFAMPATFVETVFSISQLALLYFLKYVLLDCSQTAYTLPEESDEQESEAIPEEEILLSALQVSPPSLLMEYLA